MELLHDHYLPGTRTHWHAAPKAMDSALLDLSDRYRVLRDTVELPNQFSRDTLLIPLSPLSTSVRDTQRRFGFRLIPFLWRNFNATSPLHNT